MALWTPAALENLDLWLDWADKSTITLDANDNVAEWADKSGGSNNAYQDTEAYRPSNHVDGCFSDSKIAYCYLRWPAVSTLTAIWCTNYEDSTGDYRHISSTWHGNSDASNLLFASSYTSTSIKNGTARYNGSGIAVLSVPLFTAPSVLVMQPTPGVSTYDTGAGGGVANRCFYGKHKEIILSSQTLSSEDIYKIEGYLAWKWGTETSLPVGHPYEFAAPTVFLSGDVAYTSKIHLTLDSTVITTDQTDFPLTVALDGTNPIHAGLFTDLIDDLVEFDPTIKSGDFTIDGDIVTLGTTAWRSGLFDTPIPATGKWYFELYCQTNYCMIGVATASLNTANYIGSTVEGWDYAGSNGWVHHSGASSTYGDVYTTGDVVGCAIDIDSGKIWFSKNGVWQNSGDPIAGTGEAYSGVSGTLFPAYGAYSSGSIVKSQVNESALAYTPPHGFSVFGGVLNKRFSIEAEGVQLPVEIEYWEKTKLSQLVYANTGPIAHWTMDNISGTTLVDEMSTYDGTVVGMAQTAGGKFEKYLAGANTNSVGKGITFASTIPFKSVSFWVKRYTGCPDTYVMSTISLAAGNALYLMGSGTYGNKIGTYNGAYLTTNLVITGSTTWHHVVMTLDEATGQKWIWLDGVKASALLNLGGSEINHLGRPTPSVGSNAPDIDSFQVYDYVLSDAEIAELYLSSVYTAVLHTKVPTYSASADTELVLTWDATQADNVEYVGDISEVVTSLVDEFTGTNGDDPDTTLWSIPFYKNSAAPDAVAQITNNKLQYDTGVTTGANGSASLICRYSLVGDFSVSVDFSGLSYTAGVVGIYIAGYFILVGLSGGAVFWSRLGTDSTAARSNTYGKIRIRRVGTTWYTDKLDGAGAWVNVKTTAGLTGDVVTPWIYSYIGSSSYYCNCIFDNWTVTADNIIGAPNVARSVWDDNFVAVYHMSQDPSGTAPQMLDSTSNTVNAPTVGTMLSEDSVDSLLGKALDLDGVDDGVNCGNAGVLDIQGISGLTTEAFVTPGTLAGSIDIIAKDSVGNRGFVLRQKNGLLQFESNGSVGSAQSSTLTLGTRTFVGLRQDNTAYSLFIDGLEDASATHTAVPSNTANLTIGYRDYVGYYDHYEGIVDEVRVSNIARTNDWMKLTNLSLTDQLVTYSEAPAFTSSDTPDTKKILLSLDSSAISASQPNFPLTIVLDTSHHLNLGLFNDLLVKRRSFAIEFGTTQLPVEIESWDDNGIGLVVTAKSVIFDIAGAFAGNTWGYMNIRQIDFWFEGSKIEMTTGFSAYATSTYSGQSPANAFNTSTLKTGGWANNSWMSLSSGQTNQRLIIVFDTPITFDKIVVNNCHDNGTRTEAGANKVRITISDDAITSTVYQSTMTNATALFSGNFSAHVVSNVEDPEDVVDLPGYPFKAVLHTKVPVYAASEDTLLVLSYDSEQYENIDYVGYVGDTISQTVWSDLAYVILPQDPASTMYDSATGSTLTNSGLVSGDYGGGSLTFSISDYLRSPHNPDKLLTTSATCIIRAESTVTGEKNLITKGIDNVTSSIMGAYQNSSNTLSWFFDTDGSWGPDVSATYTGWDRGLHTLSSTYDGANAYLYEDDLGSVSSATGAITMDDVGTADPVSIGGGNPLTSSNGFVGQFYGAFISQEAKSSDWIKLFHLSLTGQLVTSSFYTGFHPSTISGNQRITVVLDSTAITSDLIDFPLTVILDSTNTLHAELFADLGTSNKKLAVELGTTQLPVEIESWEIGSYTDTQTVYSPALNGSGYNNHVLRTVHDLSTDGTVGHISQIRIWIPAVVGGVSWTPVSCYVGKHAGGDNVNYTTTPIQVLFGGATSSATGTTGIWSDWMDCVLEHTDDIVTSIGCTYTSPPYVRTTDDAAILYAGQVVGYTLAGDTTVTASMNTYHFGSAGFETRVVVTPKATLHTKVPTYSASADTELILSYDSTQADNTYVGDTGDSIAQTVWDSYYKRVVNFAQDPSGPAPQILDSTSNGVHGTSEGSMTSADLIDMSIGKGLALDGVDDAVDFGTGVGTPAWTYEAFIQTDSAVSGDGIIVIDGDGLVFVDPTNMYSSLRDSGATVAGLAFHTDEIYLASTYDEATELLYENGSENGHTISNLGWSLSGVDRIGSGYLARKPQMSIGMVRVSTIARSADWIKATNLSLTGQLATYYIVPPVIFYYNNSYPKDNIKKYGLQQLLASTVTMSGGVGVSSYDTSFYYSNGQLINSVSGTNSGNEVSTTLDTPTGTSYSWYLETSVSGTNTSRSPDYPFYVRYLCAGTCTDPYGTASGINVRLYRKSTGELIEETTTSGSGIFSMDTSLNEEHYAVAIHPDETINALIYDHLVP